jgi:hypothetical protein
VGGQVDVDDGPERGRMTDRGHPADLLAGRVQHELGGGPAHAPGADQRRHRAGVDAVGAAGEDQQRCAVGVEDQAVGDRADLAAERAGGRGRGRHGLVETADVGVHPGGP